LLSLLQKVIYPLSGEEKYLDLLSFQKVFSIPREGEERI